jgi:cell division protein DivIC
MLIFSSLFFAILISTVLSDWMQIMNNKKETEELLKRKEELLEEEASLKSEVNKLRDPDYIARYAREKYMYTKDGEVILKIISEDKKE